MLILWRDTRCVSGPRSSPAACQCCMHSCMPNPASGRQVAEVRQVRPMARTRGHITGGSFHPSLLNVSPVGAAGAPSAGFKWPFSRSQMAQPQPSCCSYVLLGRSRPGSAAGTLRQRRTARGQTVMVVAVFSQLVSAFTCFAGQLTPQRAPPRSAPPPRPNPMAPC